MCEERCEDIITQIEELRQKLNGAYTTHTAFTAEIVELSKELDNLLNTFYRHHTYSQTTRR